MLVDHADALRAKYQAEGVAEDKERAPNPALPPLPKGASGAYPSSWTTQVKIHLQRAAIVLKRDPMLARLRVGSSVAVGTVAGTLWFKLSDDLAGVNDLISLVCQQLELEPSTWPALPALPALACPSPALSALALPSLP